MNPAIQEVTRIAFGDLSDLIARVFIANGVSSGNASILAANCAGCERDGSLSHGVFRVPGYVASLRSGWVDGHAVPAVEAAANAFLRVDARNGFAQPALAAAMPHLLDLVATSGAAVLAMRDSHHFSALWPDVEPLAERGLVALSMVSGLACVVPPGGRKVVYGTNPLAFATPVAGASPLVFDFATSALSNGDLRIAAREGRTLEPGCGIDSDGRPTNQPDAILNGGALLPFGGHKGAAIALMVEVLASALTGGQFSAEVDFTGHPGAETPRTGQLLIVIDPSRQSGQGFAARVRSLMETVRGSGDVRLPSDRRYHARARSEREGISIAVSKLAELHGLAS